MTVPEVAKLLGVHQATVRGWIRRGCPTVELGSVGRGHGTVLDPEEVQQWRIAERFPTVARQAETDALKIVATALAVFLRTDNRAGQVLPVEEFVMEFYARLYLNVKQTPLERHDLPDALERACAIYLSSLRQSSRRN